MSAPDKSCSECGTPFTCGCHSAAGSCWCADYPAIMPADFSRECRCPRCLARVIGRKIEERLAEIPHAEALRLAAVRPSPQRLIEHIDYTLEQGFLVFTRWYLLKQRKCCGSGCRNCPYPPSGNL